MPAKKPTIKAEITEVEIRKHLGKPNSEVYQINDEKNRVRLRYHAPPRDPALPKTAAWYIVHYRNNKAVWHKVGTWPYVTRSALFDALPDLRARLELGEKPTLNKWQTVAELLQWYQARCEADRHFDPSTLANLKSSIKNQLMPCLGHEDINDITKGLLDVEFFQPLQARHTLGVVRQHLAFLKRAFKRASHLDLIEINPLADITFSTFTSAKIKAKASALKSHDLPDLLWSFKDAKNPAAVMLCELMLAHGTRKTETTALRWEYFDTQGRRLVLPEDITKTKTEFTIPVTDYMFDLLLSWRKQQRAMGYTGVWLFPSPTGKSHISKTLADQWVRAISLGNWSAHDLRKLARTIWAETGIDYFIAEQLLNHALKDLNKAYIHTEVEDGKRQALGQFHTLLTQRKQARDAKTTARPAQMLSIDELINDAA